ncbi:MAG: DUF4230 domain-containing protein [Saccharofermentans sp.]|nr:DUF4230 domain-containing protein [Saccharofermentans sp.]
MKKIRSTLIIALICLLVGVIITLSIILAVKSAQAKAEALLNEETSVNVILMEEQLRETGFLVTEEYLVTLIQDNEQHIDDWNGNPIWGTSSRVVFSYDALVRAGVNFENVEVRVNDRRNTITIYIPDAEIYGDPSIDPESYHLYVDDFGIFSSGFSVNDFNDMLGNLQDEAKNRANEVGIIDRANVNAETMITNMVQSIISGIEEYNGYQVVIERQSNGVPVRD